MQARINAILWAILLHSVFLFSAVFFSGCGYTWQGKSNHWRGQGIEKVYIKTLTNNTLKPGVEAMFTSALVKEFSRGNRLKIVTSEKDADGVILGSVDGVHSSVNASTNLSDTSKDPRAQAITDFSVASDYVVTASISVVLMRKKDSATLWSQSFGHPGRIYPGNNRFGPEGNTSALINSSQEDLALNEIAQFVASDAYDTLMEAF